MNHDRKKIIINEIIYWKNNKLLPEAYCNFLLTLYTEGEGVGLPEKTEASTFTSVKVAIFTLLGIGLLLPVLFLVTYFTEISPNLQMVINFIFLIVSIFIVVKNNNNQLILHIGFIILALQLLILSTTAVESFLNGKSTYMILVLLLNCLIWIGVGIATTKKYFLVAGVVGILTGILLFI
ncbi:hypothetical protein [Fredinandcohnia sp. 179-A 10B2 NHS]|uniref:hypothetical protein n=1 Tax=Fredinandcohnia sp. 179-A 10B2 NHS TaxID=3235176 RepID=UPI0039A0A689